MVVYNAKALQQEAVMFMKYFHLDQGLPIWVSAALTKEKSSILPPTLSCQTIRKWFQVYQEVGELPSVIARRLGRQWRSKGRHYTFSDGEFKVLEDLLAVEPIMYLDEMVDFMKKTFGVKVSISSMWNNLRRRGYTRKKVYEKASQAIQLRKDMFVAALRVALMSSGEPRPEMLLMIDESSKGRKDGKRTHGYSKGGLPVNYHHPFNRDISYTLIGVADCFGFVPHMCGTVMREIVEKEELGSVTAEIFEEFMRVKVVPFLGNYSRGEPHSVVVMDNCSIHMSAEVEEMVRDAGAILLYSAPYAPDLIPIEAMFSKWKAYLKRYKVQFADNWRMVHDMALKSITAEEGLNYFTRTTLFEVVENHPLYRRSEREKEEVIVAAAVAAVSVTFFL